MICGLIMLLSGVTIFVGLEGVGCCCRRKVYNFFLSHVVGKAWRNVDIEYVNIISS